MRTVATIDPPPDSCDDIHRRSFRPMPCATSTPSVARSLVPLVVRRPVSHAVSVAHSLGVGRFGPGGFDLEKILGGVEKAGYNQVFVIGGDGTHKGAHCL